MYITLYILTIYLVICNRVGYGKVPDKIVGGEICSYREMRSVVSIQSHSDHVCSGNMISGYHVITTASCVMHEHFVIYGNLAVLSGTHDLRGGNRANYIRTTNVEFVIIHPEYDPKNFWINDISILKLEKKISSNFAHKPIDIRKNNFLQSRMFVAGWGGTFPNDEPSNLLKKIEVFNLQKKRCQKYYGQFGFDYGIQQCALTENPSTAYVTMGDSGSPVASRRTLFGIVSLIPVENDEPFVYTNMNFYGDWIHERVMNY
ncbi:venom serine protease 34-like [Aphidius gifuensis]|uniref:venom serine protease 34-like n=1 Tax=Aphidius gifuensis TaxID=684658 RepID=UPI001CDC2422|nr:venom serine protease 34-like [Aphidius gifuensis]